MQCPACYVEVESGQQFCHACGQSLTGVTDPTELLDTVNVVPDDDTTQPREEHAPVDTPLAGGPDLAIAVPPPGAGSVPAPPPDWRAGPLPISNTPPSATNAPGSPSVPATPTPATPAPATPVAASPASTDTRVQPIGDPAEQYARISDPGPLTVPSGAAANPLDSVPWQDEELEPVVDRTEVLPETEGPTPLAVIDASPRPVFDGAEEHATAVAPEPEGFRLRATFILAMLAVPATLLASLATVIDLRTSIPVDGITPGLQMLDDIGGNLAVAGFIGAATMLLGALAACFGLRWGSGVAGGAGLAMTGWAALVIGLFERPIFFAEETFRSSSVAPGTVLTTTRDVGWFLLVAIAALGLLVFAVSLRQCGTGGRRGLNPWIAALGALGTVVYAAGPLIPLGEADVASNLGLSNEPSMFFAGRLVQLGLIVVAGVVGFLSVRTYGLGLATGGLAVATWMWATAIADIGSRPVGPALGNLGTVNITPHAVTTVGVAFSVLMLAIATTTAAVRGSGASSTN